MISKKYVWWAFAAMIVVQIFVPARMTWQSEKTISNGRIWHFKTIPVDPNDPFRGKYIRLRFAVEEERHPIQDGISIDDGQKVYAILVDREGYADIAEILISAPQDDRPYVKATMRSTSDGAAYIDLPFDKFFMEESLAQPAEDAVRALRSDDAAVVSAQVHILDGNGVLEDVVINGMSIADYVRSQR